MIRQPLSRNTRTRGSKVKQAGHICLLLTTFIWLLYQVRHSYYKNKEYEEPSPEFLPIPNSIKSREEVIKLGRKDLSNPLTDASLGKGSQDEDEELGEYIKDVKVEEKEEEQEEESVLEGRGVGDDETDATDQERAEEEDSELELGDLIDEEDWEKDDASLEEEIEDHSRRGNDSQDSRKVEEGENDAQGSTLKLVDRIRGLGSVNGEDTRNREENSFL